MSTLDPKAEGDAPARSPLRLVWSNPAPPPPRRRVNLAQAIERHLAGRDGLTDDEFARVFARSRARG